MLFDQDEQKETDYNKKSFDFVAASFTDKEAMILWICTTLIDRTCVFIDWGLTIFFSSFDIFSLFLQVFVGLLHIQNSLEYVVHVPHFFRSGEGSMRVFRGADVAGARVRDQSQ